MRVLWRSKNKLWISSRWEAGGEKEREGEREREREREREK